MIEYPDSPDTPQSQLPFRPARKGGHLVFVSGQASGDAIGKIVPDSLEGEMRRSIANLEKAVKVAGSDLTHGVRTRNHVRDGADPAAFDRLHPAFVGPRTPLTNCLTPALRYEIECIAAVREDAQGDAK